MSPSAKTKSAAVRERLSHPIIDADGHTLEVFSAVLAYMREVGGEKVAARYLASLPGGAETLDGGLDRVGGAPGWHGLSRQQRYDMRVTRPGFWGHPMNALDRATVMLPNLFRERLDDLGIDFAIVYSSSANFLRNPDDEIRRVGCRALNTMYAEIFGPHRDRMTPAAVIPMNTPDEAIDELNYAVGKLGMKAIFIESCIRRPISAVARKAPDVSSYATWIDTLGHASQYDYDPVWRKCLELKVAPTAHAGSRGWGARTSPENTMYNHIGMFAAAGEAFCKALVIGGVVQRFPTLKFAFLEGGVGWACSLYNDLIEHWEKRNIKTLRETLDPAKLDRALIGEMFAKYGGKLAEFEEYVPHYQLREDPAELDEWSALKIENAKAFEGFFKNFFFGCEADDRMTAVAVNPKLNHFGTKLQALFGSDIGHWDVPDITKVVSEAFELVEDGLLSEDDFRDFTFTNAVKLHGSMNPDFFKGTAVADAARAILSAAPAPSA